MSPVHSYALVAGAVLMSYSYFAQEALGERLDGALVVVTLVAHVVGVLAIALGLPAWQAVQAHRTPVAGAVGMVLVFFGLPVLEIVGATFAAASSQQVGLEEAVMETPLFWGVIAAMAAANLGLLVLAVATFRAGVLPRPAAVLVFIGPLLAYLSPVSFPYDEAVALSLAFLGMAWIGVHLVTHASTSAIRDRNAQALV